MPTDHQRPTAPAPAEQALKCSDCGGEYRYDISIPSTLWNRVIRANGLERSGELLCGACILAAFVKANEPFTAYLAGDGVSGSMIHVEVNGGVPREQGDPQRPTPPAPPRDLVPGVDFDIDGNPWSDEAASIQKQNEDRATREAAPTPTQRPTEARAEQWSNTNGHRFRDRQCAECGMTLQTFEATRYPWCEFTPEREPKRILSDPGSACSSWCGYCGRCT